MHTELCILFPDFPRVTIGPSNPLKVEEGESAQFECNVDAKPQVTSVKWMRNKRFVEVDFRHTITKVKKSSAGLYTCSADNGLGKVGKSDVTLEVLYAPEVTLPEGREVNEGDDVFIDCKVKANPQPTSIQWFKDGNERFIQSGPTLRLQRVKAEDNGKYICSASNFIEPTGQQKIMRTGNATIDINVHHKPGKAYVIPSNPIAVDGKRVILTCGASPPGFPAAEYKWFKGGSEATLAIGKEFIIDPARLTNAGTYHCQATNKYGSGKIATTELKVYQAPKILMHLPNSVKKREGDSGFYLTCSAVGKPKPKVKWFKDGKEINPDISNVYQVTTAVKEKLIHGGYTVQSTLKFGGPDRINHNHIMPLDRGHYTCQFTNEVASSDTTMLMKIEHSPMFVHRHNKVAYDIGQTAIINCRMQSYPAPTIDWSFGGNIIQDDKIFHEKNMTQLGDDVFQGTLKINTVLGSSYGDYVCKGTNKMGSKRSIIKLLPRDKPERPSHIRALDIGYNFITIGFEEGFNGGFVDTDYVIQYKKQNSLNPKYKECGPRNPCNITNLEQHSVYSVKVKARNRKGESKYSEEVAVLSRVDVTKIPIPKNVHYEKSTAEASFGMESTPLDLIAKIELENRDGSWRHYNAIAVKDTDFAEMEIDEAVTNLRVKLCLATSEELCGQYAEALVVDVRPNAATSAALREPWVIGLIVVIVLLSLVALLIIIKCCCCKKTTKTMKNVDETASSRQASLVSKPPPYTTYGIENKGVETVKDSSDDNLKANLYSQNGFNSYGGSVSYPDGANSNSNSANGGSVNSQDSLWNVKNNGNADVYTQQQQMLTANGYLPPNGANITANGHHHHYEQQYMPNGLTTGDEYTHYPYPDEYLNDRNRQYLANTSDAYAQVNKQRQQRLDSDCKSFSKAKVNRF